MARLTVASMTLDLASQGINLTKVSKGYTVVFADGYSIFCSTLVIVDSMVKSNALQQPTEAETMVAERARIKQLYDYANDNGLKPINLLGYYGESAGTLLVSLESLLTGSPKTGRRRRAEQQHHALAVCKGFAVAKKVYCNDGRIRAHNVLSSRVDNQLQRRSNKFFASLPSA